jgi:hypothetical protein
MKSCSDTNECMPGVMVACGAGATACNNTPGSFSCTCGAGYMPAPDMKSCMDIDECNTGNGGCDPMRMCMNVVGGPPTCADCSAPLVDNGATGCKCPTNQIKSGSTCAPCPACTGSDGTTTTCSSTMSSVPGDQTLFTGATIVEPAATLFAYQVTLPANTQIVSAQLLSTSSTSVNVKVGIYSDVAGAPSMLVASTTTFQVASTGATAMLSVTPGFSCSTTPATYWIAGVGDGSISLAAGPASSFVSVATAGTDLPTTWPASPAAASAPAPSIWVVTTHP